MDDDDEYETEGEPLTAIIVAEIRPSLLVAVAARCAMHVASALEAVAIEVYTVAGQHYSYGFMRQRMHEQAAREIETIIGEE